MVYFYGHLLRYCTARSIARVYEFQVRRWAAPQDGALVKTADTIASKRGAPPTMGEAGGAQSDSCRRWLLLTSNGGPLHELTGPSAQRRHGLLATAWVHLEGSRRFDDILE